jgi:two-component system phosphate regulon response regulator PhoB
MRKTRIHVLEDDQEIRNVIEILLKEEGFDVQLSSSFSQLKENIQDAMPDLFLLDVMLPDGNGADICRDLKTDVFTKHIPVVIMSAQNNTELNDTSVLADDYISKPFDIFGLITKLKKLIEKYNEEKLIKD